jgi:hypothetical protein
VAAQLLNRDADGARPPPEELVNPACRPRLKTLAEGPREPASPGLSPVARDYLGFGAPGFIRALRSPVRLYHHKHWPAICLVIMNHQQNDLLGVDWF